MKALLASFFILISTLASAQYEYEEEMKSLLTSASHEPGNLVAIVEDGSVAYETFRGMASLEHEIPLNAETVMDIGTMAMHFTAACILQLESEGQLSLKDLVTQHLPAFPKYTEGSISLQHLLNHTSGIRDYTSLLLASGQSFHGTHDQESVLTFIQKQKALTITPGSEYRFSQSNYVLLAAIVEAVSGQSYREYISEHFFIPYGMENTYVYDDPALLIKNRANGYSPTGDSWELDQRYNFTVYGDGRIYSSLSDLGKWVVNIQKSPIYSRIIERGVLNDGSQMTYANGLEQGVFNGKEIFAHNGYFGAFSSMYIHFVDDNKTIITMGNRVGFSAPGSAYGAADIFIPRPVAEGREAEARETLDLGKETLEKYAGPYFYANYGYVRELYVENDTLTYKINEEITRKLLPISENEFVAVGQSPRTVWRFVDERMQVLNEGDLLYDYEKYEPATYTLAALERLEGKYYSAELGVEYELKQVDGNLVTMMNGREIAVFQPVYEGVFTSAHDGYIRVDGKRFVLNDYSLGKVSFIKRG